jgi:RecB family exonuclease
MAKKEDTIKLSATRISMFLQCKWKYWCRYKEHFPRLFNPVFALGTACHESLEFAGKIWQEKGRFTEEDKIKIIEKYDESAAKEGLSDLAVHSEGKDLIRRRIEDFAVGRSIIGLEDTFGMKDGIDVITPTGVPLIGAIDKAVEIDDDTILIIDYKTSKTAPDASQLKNDLQLSLYDVASEIMYPKYKRRILSLDMLKHDMLYTYRTEEERLDFVDYLTAIYKEMTTMKKKDAKPSLNTFCAWCDFKDNCSAYKDAYEKHEYIFATIDGYTNQELMEEWDRLKSTKKILEGRERELSMIMMEKIRNTGESIIEDGRELYIRQNARKTYDLKVVHGCVPSDDFPKLVNVNKRSVDKYLSKNPAVRDTIVNGSTTNFTSPFLGSRKFKANKAEIKRKNKK